ncbi:DUF3106 domain-containing protein [Ideonella paludis]|uniref:DUF3106 domain-containing protein n=1 Tax=Ideonella paludis TaxID=1233411 RepID=A0ABS5DVS6_9BURK|nr:DUF3106 domain-containing protein [Ideonella paludis]MBQ0934956.1 DUF3106 domain-containing protein [Ideonella paludis]
MFRSAKSLSNARRQSVGGAVVCAGLLLCGALAQPAAAAPLTAQASPDWAGLTPSQQQVLQPLRPEWASMNDDRRQKWLEIAARFPSMTPENQQRVRDRMREWSRMTPQQRSEARLVFQQTKQVPEAQRQAQWEAYQALPPEKKAEFAARAKPAVTAAAASGATQAKAQSPHQAVRSAPLAAQVQKSNVVVAPPTNTPIARAVAPTVVRSSTGATTSLITKPPASPTHQQAGLPKITANPGMVDRKTLLPQRGPQGAAIQPTATAAIAASGASAQ